jgi:hypothetical protein
VAISMAPDSESAPVDAALLLVTQARIDALEAALQQRDVVIRELTSSVARLSRLLGARPASPRRAAPSGTPTVAISLAQLSRPLETPLPRGGELSTPPRVVVALATLTARLDAPHPSAPPAQSTLGSAVAHVGSASAGIRARGLGARTGESPIILVAHARARTGAPDSVRRCGLSRADRGVPQIADNDNAACDNRRRNRPSNDTAPRAQASNVPS